MTTLKDMGLIEKKSGGGFSPVPEGTYDAVVHAVIGLGLQEQDPDYKTGKPNQPDKEIRVLFELPDVVRDDEQTSIVKLDMRLSTNEKSYYFALCKAVYGPSVTLEKVVTTPVQELLGKQLSLTVLQWSNPKTQRSGNSIKKDCMHVLDKRLAAVATKATRKPFMFNPYSPDVEVFKTLLSYWTQKNIMEALDSEQYPKELHEAWVQVQENKADTSTADNNNYNTGAIE